MSYVVFIRGSLTVIYPRHVTWWVPRVLRLKLDYCFTVVVVVVDDEEEEEEERGGGGVKVLFPVLSPYEKTRFP